MITAIDAVNHLLLVNEIIRLEEKNGRVEARLDRRFDQVDHRFDQLDSRINQHESRIERIEDAVFEIRDYLPRLEPRGIDSVRRRNLPRLSPVMQQNNGTS